MVYFPKRLQVFVSSTYLDLIEERQAAVQAILEAKHIPAGMELFTAGDQSQWEVIKHWIDQSDVYLLILGGRYGSIDPNNKEGKSYTHLEYEYALEKNIPIFSCVLRDPDKRAMEKGDLQKHLERDNPSKYHEFKKSVTSKMVKFWENSNDIEKSIILTLKDFERRDNIIGWIKGNQQTPNSLQLDEIEKLNKELNSKINQLNQQLETERSQASNLSDKLKIAQSELSEKSLIITQLQEQIKQLQFPVKIITAEIELKSAKGVDYTKLRDLLAAGKWKEADQETANVMLQAANRVSERYLRVEDIDNFPCEDLRTIDQLWVKYSNGKFGFSVQKKIYIDDLKGTREYNVEIWKEFGDRVGWRKGGNWLNYSDLTFELLDTTPVAHLPHLPHYLLAGEGGAGGRECHSLFSRTLFWHRAPRTLFSRTDL
ncbi:GUN4 domain-containing protein [Crocosphaera sp. XPORK-15E]|uniref:GUN4 domain-containing protein n=1 Tax=Crocosphaera sp. XPORK-15E TaxID=3110247 RepID=UPI002B21EA22|nr:GUN4 domain-containing protein [Crocosphaera sp. XPORK-15E]MEA5537010.1 GUN4 domain-containing protein [Crocosphaera sp. XPORK-15E]